MHTIPGSSHRFVLTTVFLLTLILAPASAFAAAYVVDRTDDTNVAACDPAVPNDCTLRGAITNVNTAAGLHTITHKGEMS